MRSLVPMPPAAPVMRTGFIYIPSIASKLRKLEHGVPVAAGAAGAEPRFDQAVGEARATNASGLDDVELPTFGADDFRSDDGGAQGLYSLGDQPLLQDHDDEM